MCSLWNKNQEIDFFTKSLDFATPEQLFYLTKDNNYYAYWPKSYKEERYTLQSRNSLIGSYSEKWSTDLFREIAEEIGGYSVQKMVSKEIGLTNKSPADVAICKTKDVVQKPQNILMILEVKISVVWNWEFIPVNENDFDLTCIGDYTTHRGNPGLLRSDTMLKAIGKSASIRASSLSSARIPIVIIGNTPITEYYYEKVDNIKKNGIIQGFWSVNPDPLDGNDESIKNTPAKGFYKFDDYEELKHASLNLLKEEGEFFSSMQTKEALGEIIEIANSETTYEAKGQRFIELLRGSNE